MNVPVPSHHGHVTSFGVPPRVEITLPVPRHGEHGRDSALSSGGCGSSAAIGSVRLPVARGASRAGKSCRWPRHSRSLVRRAPGRPTPMPARDGRFAPSPTGTLHLGNLRTALLAWLFARSQDARHLVRMEDLDTGRVREHFYDEQLRDLAALGLDWDGPVVRQSERLALYDDAIETLRAQGLVYECWCTRAEIREAASAPHGELPEGF